MGRKIGKGFQGLNSSKERGREAMGRTLEPVCNKKRDACGEVKAAWVCLVWKKKYQSM